MAAGIGITVTGLQEALNKLVHSKRNIIDEAARSLHKSGEIIMGDSKENYVPVATGVLRGTGHVELPKKRSNEVIIEMGFGGPAAPYAAATHENPRAGETEGVSPSGQKYPTTMGGKPTWATHGEWKYLETPTKKHTNSSEKRLFTNIENFMKRGGG